MFLSTHVQMMLISNLYCDLSIIFVTFQNVNRVVFSRRRKLFQTSFIPTFRLILVDGIKILTEIIFLTLHYVQRKVFVVQCSMCISCTCSLIWNGMKTSMNSFILIWIHTMQTEIMVIQLNKNPISRKFFEFVLCICSVFSVQSVSSDCQNEQCSFLI